MAQVTVKPKFLKGLKFFQSNHCTPTRKFFTSLGCEYTEGMWEADFHVFTGGADISPILYGERAIQGTYHNISRDFTEIKIAKALSNDTPKIGICRGGQLLNILAGGSLWQDVDGHHGNHLTKDLLTGSLRTVTSVHHQMMIPTEDSHILSLAEESTYKKSDEFRVDVCHAKEGQDVEALFIPRTNALCFQGHPEYASSTDDCVDYFLTLMSHQFTDKEKLCVV